MAPYTVHKSLDQGLYFLDGQRKTIEKPKYSREFDVFEPRIGKVVAKCPIAPKELVDRVCTDAKKAQPAWGKIVPMERAKVLLKVADIIRENVDELAVWESKTNGKSVNEAREDILSSADTFMFYGGIAPAVLKGDHFELPDDRFCYTRCEPFGVVGCIGAWNYPFQTCVWKVAPALAAGNAVVYKPSPFAPGSPVALGEVLKAAGLPDGVYNVVQGDAETGEALCQNEDIRRVSFTGSVETGKAIQRNCALKNIKPVTLELGGKSAFIVFEDADINEAVNAAILANFLNQGEVCTNATRVFVQESIVDEFVEKLKKECDKVKVGDPLKGENNVGAMINEGHLNKVLGFVESAVKEASYEFATLNLPFK
ncbi:unnamed protein product [Bursaphelenchus xylophilus]|uniref:(pine wood nematode) hypothetical protein n=1 Tax=Bursaphelenchus xylophilus TaxID=6326 RepID=A0A7I8XM35_BURXY|nr:unnamed protein product [Bursaphelenchus xylophilus]CAG9090326.1 unnamed protein product [Bursaphelenchus xylophilus]